MPEIIIIGAGLTGLSTAYHLKKPFVVLEKHKTPGGLCGSISDGGFTFDHSGHLLHLHDPLTKPLLDGLMAVKLDKIARQASVFTNRRYVPYPFQANLYYLPEKIRKECLDGFIRRARKRSFPPNTAFQEWSNSVFGKGITKHFMKPYNEKLWTVSASRLTSDWVAPFVPQPKLAEIISGANNRRNKEFGYNVSFYYPEAGGCQSIVNAFYDNVDNVRLGVAAGRIDPINKRLETSDGKVLRYEHIISTQPLVELLGNIKDLPASVKSAVGALSWNSVDCLNLAFRSDSRSTCPARGQHWLYFPEKKYVFYRAGIYSNIHPSMAPEGFFSMYVELSRKPGERFDGKTALSHTLAGLRDAGLTGKNSRPEITRVLKLPYAYVIYDKKRTAALKTITSFLAKNDIYSIGRYGAWEYSFMESSIIGGKKLAAKLNK